MKVRSVYIEEIENKGRALWVLGVFARDWEETMPAHARAPPLGAAAGLGFGSGSGSGSLPGLLLFESGLTGIGYAKHTRSPLSGSEPLQLDNQQLRLLQLDSQQLRLLQLGRTIATVQTEPLQPFVGFGPIGLSWSAITVSYTHLTLPTKRIV